MIKTEKLFLKAGNFNLKNINLSVKKGEYCVILGPTGSGKTLLMECLAGLKKINSGKIFLNGTDASRMPPEERNIGYLPQDYALFPFLNVAGNIGAGLKLRKCAPKIINEKIDSISETLAIKHLLNRRIKGLSGGEKQRVALARALVVNPDILLLDEPYCAVDSGMRRRLWWQMKELHKKTNKTIVHITHDFQEALALSENIHIIIDGKIERSCRREEIFARHENKKTAEFLGVYNIGEAKDFKIESGNLSVRCGNKVLHLPADGNEKEGTRLKFGILPDDIKIISKNRMENSNVFRGRVVSHIENGSIFVQIPDWSEVCPSGVIEIKSFLKSSEKDAFSEGSEIDVFLPAEKIHVFKN